MTSINLHLAARAKHAVGLQAEKNAYHQATSESTAALHVKQEELRDVLQAEHLAQTELDQLLALRRAREARIVSLLCWAVIARVCAPS